MLSHSSWQLVKRVYYFALPIILIISFFLTKSPDIFAHEENPTIIMTDQGFSPKNITINFGETVDFVNQSNSPKWPASNSHPAHAIYPEFDPQKNISPGETWHFTFTKAGSWNFHDHLDSRRGGTIVVNRSENISPIPSPTTSKSPSFSLTSFLKKIYYQLFPTKKTLVMKNISSLELLDNPAQLTYWLQILSPRDILIDLEQETRQANRQCHLEAHLLAHQVFDLYQETAFKYATQSCQSGFHHGIMEKFIAANGITDLGEKINAICNQLTEEIDRWECYHGTGHGLIAYESYDVPSAIKDCQSFFENDHSKSCMSGVFMENILSYNSPDHQSVWINDDPHFPCNQFPNEDPVLTECYRYQTIHFNHLFGDDLTAIANECLQAPINQIPMCFRSLGRDIAYDHLDNLAESEKICDSLSHGKIECFDSALGFYWETFRHNPAQKYGQSCQTLSSEVNLQKCKHIFDQ